MAIGAGAAPIDARPCPGGVMFVGLCMFGLLTHHGAMSAVLANYPDRVAANVDGYYAPLLCTDLGNDYTLIMGGHRYTVRSADCATWQKPATWPQKRAIDGRILPWLGDVTPLAGVGSLAAPTPALLCPTSP